MQNQQQSIKISFIKCCWNVSRSSNNHSSIFHAISSKVMNLSSSTSIISWIIVVNLIEISSRNFREIFKTNHINLNTKINWILFLMHYMWLKSIWFSCWMDVQCEYNRWASIEILREGQQVKHTNWNIERKKRCTFPMTYSSFMPIFYQTTNISTMGLETTPQTGTKAARYKVHPVEVKNSIASQPMINCNAI